MKLTNLEKLREMSTELTALALDTRTNSEVLSKMSASDVIKMINKECKKIMGNPGDTPNVIKLYEQLQAEKEAGRELCEADITEEVFNQLLYKEDISVKRIALLFDTPKLRVTNLKKAYKQTTDDKAILLYKEAFAQACKEAQRLTEVPTA